MIDVIRNVEQFLMQLKIGDVFWHMRSLYCKPWNIEGPCTILKFYTDVRFDTEMVAYSEGEFFDVVEKFIRDLTNEWHGVFLNSADAYAYFAERTIAYETDPKLIAEVKEARLILIERSRQLLLLCRPIHVIAKY